MPTPRHSDESARRLSPFEQAMEDCLDGIRRQDLFRELRRVDSPQSPRTRINGRTLLNFSSNDYLGLADAPELKEAAVRAVEQFGAGAGASRLICGSLAPHHELEESLAAFKQTEAALSFSSGYAASVGIIGTLMDKDDILIMDRLVHASIVDAARLCGAKLRVFAHNDLDDLERLLRWADTRPAASAAKRRPCVLVVTESIFSMDGDAAPLRGIVELKDRFGAWLMTDEAHATGLFGTNGRGLAEQENVSGRIEIQMGTLGKALGASGGFVCGSRRLADVLVNRARSFIFSTAPVPAAAAAAAAGIRLVQSPEGARRRALLWRRVDEALSMLSNTAFGRTQPRPFRSAIVPLMLGDERKAVAAGRRMFGHGVLVPAVRYPAVARGQARLRLTLSASHTEDDLQRLAAALAGLSLEN